jgi:YVTN family beta-propeller protein
MKYLAFFAIVIFFVSIISGQLVYADSSEIRSEPTPQYVDEKIIQSTTTDFSGVIPICTNPLAVAANPKTNLVYVTCWESYWDETKTDSVYVIKASDNSISDIIPVGTFPSSIAVNENNNKVYVSNYGSNSITVIDGTTNTVLSTISDINYNPYRVAIDSHTNMVYVTAANTLVVIDGSTDKIQSIIQLSRFDPNGIAINPIDHRAYISHDFTNSISVVDTLENKLVDVLTVGDRVFGLDVNPNTNLLYVSNLGGISVLDTLTNKILSRIPTNTYVSQVTVNPVTNKIYAVNSNSNSTSVIDGKTNKITNIIEVGFMAESVAVNQDTNMIYIVNRGSNPVSVIDGVTDSIVIGSQQETGDSTSKKSDYSVATIEFDSAQYFTKKMIQCFDVEELCKYRPQKDQKIVTITVTDPDSNIFNESIDRVNIFVGSDSDPKGIVITAHETHVNSGVFVEKILITDDVSGIARVHVNDGDTVYAKYIDKTLPASHDSDSLEVTVSSMIGLLGGGPFERVPVQNPQILDNRGDTISSSNVGDQIHIVTELQNLSFHKQSFAYLVQIKNQDGVTVSLSWINGTMTSKQSLKPSLSWIPQEPDTYTITIFVWESITNPTALSPTHELEITVNGSDY